MLIKHAWKIIKLCVGMNLYACIIHQNVYVQMLYISDHCTRSCFIHSNEWNSTSISKRSDQKIYTTVPVRMPQTESYSLLRVPRSHTASYRERSFRTSVPRLWNKLPNHSKLTTSKDIFCKVLKTDLLKLAYL